MLALARVTPVIWRNIEMHYWFIERFASRVVAVCIIALVMGGCGRQSPSRTAAKPSAAKSSSVPSDVAQGGSKSSKDSKIIAPPTLPNLETVVKRVTLRWMDKNMLALNASAARLEGSEVTRKAVLTDFRAELFQNGKLTTTLVAPKVEADEGKRVLTATGGVTLTSLDRGTTVKCAWVKWFARENRIVGDGGVRVVSKLVSGHRYEMEGAAFEADTALKSITITDSARGWINR